MAHPFNEPDARGLIPGMTLRPDTEISPRAFHALRADPARRVVLIDCRTAPEWAIARVEGSIHVPLDEFEARAGDLPIDEATDVGVICHHGVRSLKAALMLRAMGLADARSVAGGIDLWSLAVDAGVPRYERSAGVCRVLPGNRVDRV